MYIAEVVAKTYIGFSFNAGIQTSFDTLEFLLESMLAF